METIDGIVKEMLKEVRESEMNNPDRTTMIFLTSANMALKDFAARIKKANKSLEAEKSRIIADRNELVELNRKCCDENERLKAALQPVLECDVAKESYLAQSEVVWIAQRIWKEGATK